jgi:hypothetical protein
MDKSPTLGVGHHARSYLAYSTVKLISKSKIMESDKSDKYDKCTYLKPS